VIDPLAHLAYSTYLGGPNDDYLYDVAVDKYGSAYVAGAAFSGMPQVNPVRSRRLPHRHAVDYANFFIRAVRYYDPGGRRDHLGQALCPRGPTPNVAR
jgi:hypothetical protein